MRAAVAALGAAALFCSCVTAGRRPPPRTQERPIPAPAVRTAAPGSDGAEAALVLLRYWRKQADEVKPHIADVTNRSKLFGDLIQHYRSLFAEMDQAQGEGLELLARGDQDGAEARLNAVWMALPVATLQINYVILASHAEDAGMVTTDWMAILGDMSRRTAPVLQGALGTGFDRRQMETAAHQHRAEIAELEETFPEIQAALGRGGRWTQRGLYVADGVTMAVAAYDALGLIEGGFGGRPDVSLRFPGLTGAGAAGAGAVVVPVEVLESLRELIRLGAIGPATVSMGLTLMVGKPEAVGRQAPPPSSQPPAGGAEMEAPDPRIDGPDALDRVAHTFDEHAEKWFGRAANRRTHLERWKALLRRAARSAQVFDWDTRRTATTAHLARIEGKWFVVQFFKEGDYVGQLATAFVPNQAEARRHATEAWTLMDSLDAPFLELGFYFQDLADADAFTRVAHVLLARGSTFLAARGWRGPGRRTRPFESIRDKAYGDLTAQAEQLETVLTDPDLRVMELTFNHVVGISKAPEQLGYFGVFSEEASLLDQHPIKILAEGGAFSGLHEPERGRAPGRRTYEVFRELVETLAPSYASITVEAPVECPTDLHRDPRTHAFMDFFVNERFIGSNDLAAVARLYEGAYQQRIGEGLYVSTYQYWNPDGVSLNSNKASRLSAEVGKLVGQHRPGRV